MSNAKQNLPQNTDEMTGLIGLEDFIFNDWAIYLVAALLFITILFFCYALFLFIKGFFRKKAGKSQKISAKEQFRKLLIRLQQDQEVEAKVFYDLTAETTKSYIEEHFGYSIKDKTTEEILEDKPWQAWTAFDSEFHRPFEEFWERAEMTRFSTSVVASEDQSRDLELLASFYEKTKGGEK